MINKINDLMLKTMLKTKELIKNEEGAETIEYVVIAAVVILAGTAAYTPAVGDLITAALDKLTAAVTAAG